jgi:hypothetical protein
MAHRLFKCYYSFEVLNWVIETCLVFICVCINVVLKRWEFSYIIVLAVPLDRFSVGNSSVSTGNSRWPDSITHNA